MLTDLAKLVNVKFEYKAGIWISQNGGEFTRGACFAFMGPGLTEFVWDIKEDTVRELLPYMDTYIRPLLKYDWNIDDYDEKTGKVRWKVPEGAGYGTNEWQRFRLRVYTFGTLVRYLSEYPYRVAKWAEYCSFMPTDEAYLTCSHTSMNDCSRYNGHSFPHSLENLQRLRGFTFQHYLDVVDKYVPRTMFAALDLTDYFRPRRDNSTLSNSIHQSAYLKFTPATYQLFCELEPFNSSAQSDKWTLRCKEKEPKKYAEIDLFSV